MTVASSLCAVWFWLVTVTSSPWATNCIKREENVTWQLSLILWSKSCVYKLWMNEWMNEWCTYIALYYVLLYTQSALQSCGGGLSSTTTSVQHPLGWCDGSHRTMAPVRSPHTSYRWRGERVIESIQWIGIIRRPCLTRASGGNLARTQRLHPYSLREVSWDF